MQFPSTHSNVMRFPLLLLPPFITPPPPPPTPTQPNDIMRPGGNGWAEMVLAPPGQGGGATITQPVRETGSNYSMDHARAVTQKSERERRMRERERDISVR